MAKNKYTSEYRAQIVTDLVKRSYVHNDELKTRVNLLENILALKERAIEDEKESLFLDDIKNELFSYSFDVLDDIYHGLFVVSEEKPEIDETKQPLYEQLMSLKKNQKLTLYFEGKEKLNYTFISRFIFEDELFVILKDNSGEKVYRYTYRDEKEKIAPIKDDNLLRFLKQLNED